MAATTDGAAHQTSAKTSSQESLHEFSDHYNMDDIEDCLDDGVGDDAMRRGHTKNDQKDMNRMGKRQELIVCSPREVSIRYRCD